MIPSELTHQNPTVLYRLHTLRSLISVSAERTIRVGTITLSLLAILTIYSLIFRVWRWNWVWSPYDNMEVRSRVSITNTHGKCVRVCMTFLSAQLSSFSFTPWFDRIFVFVSIFFFLSREVECAHISVVTTVSKFTKMKPPMLGRPFFKNDTHIFHRIA